MLVDLKLMIFGKILSINISMKRNSGNFCLPIAPNLFLEIVRFKPDVVIMRVFLTWQTLSTLYTVNFSKFHLYSGIGDR